MWPNHLNATFQLEDRTIKTRSAKKPRAERVQYGALPYRRAGEADMQVLLVTSRGTKRWIIPKGWPIAGLSPNQTAAREALEEAVALMNRNDAPARKAIEELYYAEGPAVQA